MTGVMTAPSAAETDRRSGLFLIEGGVHPDVTSLFLLTEPDPDVQQQLIGSVGIIKELVKKYERSRGDTASPRRTRSSLEMASFCAIRQIYPKLGNNFVMRFSYFRDELTGHNSDELEQIETEFTAIMNGEIELSEAEKQQLSNLSNGGLHEYSRTLGISLDDLTFPLLDVGTGIDASFAQNVLQTFPDQRVVSTSMHLSNPNSVMSRRLAGQADRGELVAADGTNLPFADETFGTIVSVNADPYYVPRSDLPASLKEKHRVMQIGAKTLLCPAICDYGNHDIVESDIAPLRSEINVSLRPIPRHGRWVYDHGMSRMVVIEK